MPMNIKSYRYKVFLYSGLLFIALGVVIALFQRRSETKVKEDFIAMRTEDCANFIHAYLKEEAAPGAFASLSDTLLSKLPPLLASMPQSWRYTVVDEQGKVLYDSRLPGQTDFENHALRPEIRQAHAQRVGSALRKSATTGEEYFYFGKRFYTDGGTPYYIRVAVPYASDFSQLLRHNNLFVFLLGGVLLVGLIFILLFTDHISRSTQALRDFIRRANRSGTYDEVTFPKTELGEIGEQVKETFNILHNSNRRLREEQQKLIRHFSESHEGIAFLNPDGSLIYANSHFVQNLNKIADKPNYIINQAYLEEHLVGIRDMLLQGQTAPVRYIEQIEATYIEVRGQIFPDKSYEIVLTDVSRQEQARRLKHEMTAGIAHELRTPVSCIRGYLETLINNPDLPREKQGLFLSRSFDQTMRLSSLISDVSQITKLEEAAEYYTCEPLFPAQVVQEVATALELRLKENNMQLLNYIPATNQIEGNLSLLYSVFTNLAENSIRYAGAGARIEVRLSMEDDRFCYYTFSDNGRGVAHSEVDLTKIFNRFYRGGEGRSRSDGGSGLGLSLVKNAVLFHGGEISVKQGAEGGLVFFFSLAKKHQPYCEQEKTPPPPTAQD